LNINAAYMLTPVLLVVQLARCFQLGQITRRCDQTLDSFQSIKSKIHSRIRHSFIVLSNVIRRGVI
jgi:hypothetical protein